MRYYGFITDLGERASAGVITWVMAAGGNVVGAGFGNRDLFSVTLYSRMRCHW